MRGIPEQQSVPLFLLKRLWEQIALKRPALTSVGSMRGPEVGLLLSLVLPSLGQKLLPLWEMQRVPESGGQGKVTRGKNFLWQRGSTPKQRLGRVATTPQG